MRKPVFELLSEAEIRLLDDLRKRLLATTTCGPVQFPEGTVPTTLEIADALVRWWHTSRDDSVLDAPLIVDLAGVALGDALVETFELSWRVITDAHGKDIGLTADPNRTAEDVIVSPFSIVGKRFSDARDTPLVRDAYDGVSALIEKRELARRRCLQ